MNKNIQKICLLTLIALSNLNCMEDGGPDSSIFYESQQDSEQKTEDLCKTFDQMSNDQKALIVEQAKNLSKYIIKKINIGKPLSTVEFKMILETEFELKEEFELPTLMI